MDALDQVFGTLIDATRAGELDALMASAAEIQPGLIRKTKRTI
jgi:hypothetical protein